MTGVQTCALPIYGYLLADENGTSIKVARYAGTNKVDLLEVPIVLPAMNIIAMINDKNK